MPEPPVPRQSWPWKHPVLTAVGTTLVLIFLVAGIFGSNSSTNTATVTQVQTTTQTQTVTRPRSRAVRTIVRRGPAQTVTVTRTVTSTTSAVAGTTGAGTSQAVEGPGSLSHATDAQFCSSHTCIPNFPNGNGMIVQCVDGEWSHSGGLSGACSDHGGEA